MIAINSVFKYIDSENEEKIRIINIINNYVYMTNVDGSTSMPRKELIETVLQDINAEKLVLVKDPFVRIIDEKDWEVIRAYWEVNKYDLLEKHLRTKKFEKISKVIGLSVPKVKKIFSRYWQRGMNKNALLPDYINSGAKGKKINKE